MIFPPPQPGLVISYAYLWHHEHRTGMAPKPRQPVAIARATGPNPVR